MLGFDGTMAGWPTTSARVSTAPDLLRGLSPRERRLAGWLPGVAGLARLYPIFHARPEPLVADRALATLGIRWEASDVARVPSSGPLIAIANHPLGILDGLVLSSVLSSRRPDVRLLATSLLGALEDFRSDLFLVDVFHGRDAIRRNARALREAIRWVRQGGCLVVFPSGAVSHFAPALAAVADPVWHPSIARLVRLANATVLPCAIEGRNSLLFQAGGLLHPLVRTVLLPRELLRRRGSVVPVHVGSPIPAGALAGVPDAEATDRFRRGCYALRDGRRPRDVTAPATCITTRSAAEEAAHLSTSHALLRTRRFTVLCAEAPRMPALLQELGAARARAFQAAGEGSGAAIDLDGFDHRYLHLLLWDEQDHRVAGAYRIGCVDAGTRPSDLYTRTLFRYDYRLVRAIAPALELGRAFVLPEYQKQVAPLMLLWSGIARFVARNPHYRYLFGAVSISTAYSDVARGTIVRFLRRHARSEFSPLVRARRPFRAGIEGVCPATAEALDRAVGSSVTGAAGMPVLLRQYLKLGARALAFSLDPDFGGVLDALVLIDLPQVPAPLLAKYMGATDAAAYRAHHRPEPVVLSRPDDACELTA